MSSAHQTRYNRLGVPPKSQSQPANLASLHGFSSSSDSLTGCSVVLSSDEGAEGVTQVSPSVTLLLEEGEREICQQQQQGSNLVELESHFTPNSVNGTTTTTVRKSNKKIGMKHSFSSFFPFTSCATTKSASSPPLASTSNDSTSGTARVLNQGSPLAMTITNGNSNTSFLNHIKTEVDTVINNENDDEEISDLGKYASLLLGFSSYIGLLFIVYYAPKVYPT